MHFCANMEIINPYALKKLIQMFSWYVNKTGNFFSVFLPTF